MGLRGICRIVLIALCCRYGDEVENYWDVFQRTLNLLARVNTRKSHGEDLLENAQQARTFPVYWIFLLV